MHNIAKYYSKFTRDKIRCKHPFNIRLADPQFNIPSDIDILIGAKKVWEVRPGTRKVRSYQ